MSRRIGIQSPSRGTESLRRKRPSLDPQPYILIVCEGHKTEPLYFGALRRYRRLSATKIDIVPGGISGSDPRSIVKYARKRKKWMKRRGMRFDAVWCVFDRDEHPKIEEAFRWARESHFHLGYSNPCFELWFLLHYRDIDAPLGRFEALKALRRLMPAYRKTSSVFNLLLPRQAQAIRRAEHLRQRLTDEHRDEGENPSTSVDLLVNYLNGLQGRPRGKSPAPRAARNAPVSHSRPDSRRRKAERKHSQ